jgi:hypothetical protein
MAFSYTAWQLDCCALRSDSLQVAFSPWPIALGGLSCQLSSGRAHLAR